MSGRCCSGHPPNGGDCDRVSDDDLGCALPLLTAPFTVQHSLHLGGEPTRAVDGDRPREYDCIRDRGGLCERHGRGPRAWRGKSSGGNGGQSKLHAPNEAMSTDASQLGPSTPEKRGRCVAQWFRLQATRPRHARCSLQAALFARIITIRTTVRILCRLRPRRNSNCNLRAAASLSVVGIARRAAPASMAALRDDRRHQA